MIDSQRPQPDEVEHLMLNAQLRNELEPFLDESVNLLDFRRLPTPRENEFLASMLAWERAPVLAIANWFEPEYRLPHPDALDAQQLHEALWETIHALYKKRIVLGFTDHLSDRQLYCLIYRDILPSPEKKIDLPKNYLHWHCIDVDNDIETWLSYYASEEEREDWANKTGQLLPAVLPVPYRRKMPSRPH